jgi:hypothetical protein
VTGNPCGITSGVSPKSVMNSLRFATSTSPRHSGPAQHAEPWCTSSVVTSQRPRRRSMTSPPCTPLARKQSRPFSCRAAGRQPQAAVRGGADQANRQGCKEGRQKRQEGAEAAAPASCGHHQL